MNMSNKNSDDRYSGRGIYRCKNRRRPYRKRWYRKKTKDKKGFTCYSTGAKWAGRHEPYKPAFWRIYQDRKWHQYDSDGLLPGGYTPNQTWIALCKSWNGFLIAMREGDHADMKQYMGQIRKLQKDLGFKQTEFYGYTPAELAKIDLENDEAYLIDWYGSTL